MNSVKVKCRHHYITKECFGGCNDEKFNCEEMREDKAPLNLDLEEDLKKEWCIKEFKIDWITLIINRSIFIEVKDE